MLCESRAVSVVFGLTLLLGAVAFYLADPGAYLRAMHVWVPESLAAPFADSAYIVSQLGCWRQGVDVYVSNPCELYHRAFAYPPLWLRLWFLPSGQQATIPFALALDACFIVSLSVLPRVPRRRDIALLCAAIASSATAYGVERGNVDLAIFILAAFAIAMADRRLAFRATGYAAVTCAALLKLYPVFLLALIARERRRLAMTLALLVAGTVAVAIWQWHDQWIAMFPNIPGPEYSTDGPGGRKLPEGIFIVIDWVSRHAFLAPGAYLDDTLPRRAAVAALFAAVLLPALFLALRQARDAAFAMAVRRLDPRETICLATGALLFCGCFVSGTSSAYREIFVLFALPGLLAWQHDRRLPSMVRWTAVLTIPLMWASFPALLFDLTFGPLGSHGGPLPTFAFWLAREILWWWLFIVLSAALFQIADQIGLLAIDHARQLVNAGSDGGTGGSGIDGGGAGVAGAGVSTGVSTTQAFNLLRS